MEMEEGDINLIKEPKISINLIDKNGREHRLSTFASKVKNFGNLSLVKKAKLGNFKTLRIKVFYGQNSGGEIKNEMECNSYEDLEWAHKAYTDKFLWL